MTTPCGWRIERALQHHKRDIAKERHVRWLLDDALARALFQAPCRFCDHTTLLPSTAFIDQADPAHPFTPDNSLPTCLRCHRAMRGMSEAELLAWCATVASRQSRSTVPTATTNEV